MKNPHLKAIKERIKVEFGTRCKDTSRLCAKCIAYEAYDTLVELFTIKVK